MILISFIIITLATKTNIGLSITTTIISFGISYAFYISTVLIVSVFFSILKIENTSYLFCIISSIIQGVIQFALIYLLFKVKRLRHGMPFLIKNGASNIGVLLSVIILSAVIILSNSDTRMVFLIPIILVLICAVLIFLWWKDRITKTYIEKLRVEEMEQLKKDIIEKDERINYLEQQNDVLSKIIHKDNKLIPAMELAVKEYLSSPEADKEKGNELLKQLSAISAERYGIIEKYKNSSKKIPLTNVFSVDTTLNFMLNKASANEIDFDVDLSGSVKFMIDNIINENELNTLLADLIENAIIATKLSSSKKIIVSIGVIENSYFLSVIDSGIPFEIETFDKFGKEKASTHLNDGGSGIGLVTTFELLKKHGASLVIDELSDNHLNFTKKITIKFDGENQYIVNSGRCELIKGICTRDDLIVNEV